jgi:hypothetical protein
MPAAPRVTDSFFSSIERDARYSSTWLDMTWSTMVFSTPLGMTISDDFLDYSNGIIIIMSLPIRCMPQTLV